MSSVSVLCFYSLSEAQRLALELDGGLVLMPSCLGEWNDIFIAVSTHAMGDVCKIFTILFAHAMNNMTYNASHARLDGTVSVHMFKFTETGVRNLRQYIGMKE
jgi:hypothetical protein